MFFPLCIFAQPLRHGREQTGLSLFSRWQCQHHHSRQTLQQHFSRHAITSHRLLPEFIIGSCPATQLSKQSCLPKFLGVKIISLDIVGVAICSALNVLSVFSCYRSSYFNKMSYHNICWDTFCSLYFPAL